MKKVKNVPNSYQFGTCLCYT